MTGPRLLRLLAAAFVGAAAVGVGTASPAAADAGSDCVSAGNVWVVVQGPNGTRTGCATRFGNGEQALRSAGMSINHNSTGLICQINGHPDTCSEKPMPYWAYHVAPAGGSWSYSDLGAANRTPAAGSAEGWHYGSGAAPSAPVPSKVAPKPSTTAPKPTTRAPRPTTTAPGSGSETTKPTTPTTGTRAPKQTTAPQPRRTTSKQPTGQPTRSTTGRPGQSGQSGTSGPSGGPSTSDRGRSGTPAPSASASGSPAPDTSGTPTSATSETAPSQAPTGASTAAPTAAPSGEPVFATVDDAGSATGLFVTAGVVGVGAAGTAGALWWRRRGVM